MRPVAPDPGGYRFLLKALGEAGNELAEELFNCPRRQLDQRDGEGWSLRLIAVHVHAHEQMTAGYLERIVSRRTPALAVVDTEAVLDDPDGCREDADEAALGFAHLRRQIQYLLWDLDSAGWERCGRHPYRGEVSVAQWVRELHLHDLEFLWRARRLKEQTTASGRRTRT